MLCACWSVSERNPLTRSERASLCVGTFGQNNFQTASDSGSVRGLSLCVTMNTWKNRVTWACPDDRELALRAKLSSGWSAKTDRVFQKPEPLSTQEVSTIVEVVKKADRVEQMERDRVSRLVTQLDKLRNRCVQGQKSKRTCNMCGVGFRLLISTAQKCRICEKDVCAKCGLNAVVLQSGLNQRDAVWLCKICHEIREVWKKSGAWFYKGMPMHKLENNTENDATSEQKPE